MAIRKLVATLLVFGMACVLVPESAFAADKVAICHLPPGNPENTQSIIVGARAVPAHLAHGDTIGECPSGCLLNAGLCEDNNACTFDTCLLDGQCSHEVVDCNDGNACTDNLCDETIGCLNPPLPGAACDDGNACTGPQDVCGGDGMCTGVAILGCCSGDADCDDTNACTDAQCIDNSCVISDVVCADTNNKCVAALCSPVNGECGEAPVSCDDNNICTDDSCTFEIGCIHEPTQTPDEEIGVKCNDGLDNDCDGFKDALDPDCSGAPRCGNGVLEPGETCDDGNNVPGDGCNETCDLEPPGGCNPGEQRPCGFSDVGLCRTGLQTCDSSGSVFGLCIGLINPQPEECLNGIDEDCTGQADDGICSGGTDFDQDGFASGETGGNDCNDGDANVFPGRPEQCDGVDNDCNGIVDDVIFGEPCP